MKERLSYTIGTGPITRLRTEILHLEASVEILNKDLEQIQERIDQRNIDETRQDIVGVQESGSCKMVNESQRDFLIRTGKITPFSKMPRRSATQSDATLRELLLEAEVGEDGESDEVQAPNDIHARETLSHRNLIQPGFVNDEDSEYISESHEQFPRRSKRRRLPENSTKTPYHNLKRPKIIDSSIRKYDSSDDGLDADFDPGTEEAEIANSHFFGAETGSEADENILSSGSVRSRQRCTSKRNAHFQHQMPLNETLVGLDDGNEELYQGRLRSWTVKRKAAREKGNIRRASNTSKVKFASEISKEDAETFKDHDVAEDHEQADNEEWHLPHPATPDATFEGGYRIPGDVYPSLFDYQKTGVQWLWELYSQQVGGIVGDEMGLGKTIQVISFLTGLHYSKKLTRPIIIVAPATVMKQWVNEFHTWWPPFRVSILHASGSGMFDIGREAQRENELLSQIPRQTRKKQLKGKKAAQKIVERVVQEGHVLVTTYSGLQTYADLLVPVDWEYAVLDEGHKIRNPNTAITIYCKALRTANRIILSGTPMQNNLVELWSLFDFVFPMRLGTLVNFRQQFEFPIRQGGYANASNLQVQTAMKCAETLKDTISPYLLQRFKADVASDLPKKSEQVLFCKLTKVQRDDYEGFLRSDDLKAIVNGKRQVLAGVDILRKICNHPDLQSHRHLSVKPGYNYGSGAKSGKMQVVKALLEIWREQGHKTLLFAQHRIMLDILEKFITSLQSFNIRRMDGNTPIPRRQGMVDEFNNNPDAHVFLLTTNVGGLGINLTGANRVIIYDPDWNPATDIQARERAWRLGQKREVMIYRLMTAGTIEEKIYHRQLFKQFLTKKILHDPKQRQKFHLKDLHDLFTLGGADEAETETGGLFKGTDVKFNDDAASRPSLPLDGPTLSDDANATKHDGLDNPSSIRSLAGVASVERFRSAPESSSANEDAKNSESRIMHRIFARSGVHSALEHDQIVNGKTPLTADPKIIEREAKKVAAEAAKELKKAGEIAKTIPVGTPTWTGQFGIAGRPNHSLRRQGSGQSRGGPSSSSILVELQNRQGIDSSVDRPGSNMPAGDRSMINTPVPKGIDFMKMIRDYMLTHRGQVHTQMLIDHFNRHCTTPARTAEFKEMLKEIATLEKGSSGRAKWTLKEEYK